MYRIYFQADAVCDSEKMGILLIFTVHKHIQKPSQTKASSSESLHSTPAYDQKLQEALPSAFATLVVEISELP
jgi:hypothetical protein